MPYLVNDTPDTFFLPSLGKKIVANATLEITEAEAEYFAGHPIFDVQLTDPGVDTNDS